VQN
jgi:hypothetical protein